MFRHHNIGFPVVWGVGLLAAKADEIVDAKGIMPTFENRVEKDSTKIENSKIKYN